MIKEYYAKTDPLSTIGLLGHKRLPILSSSLLLSPIPTLSCRSKLAFWASDHLSRNDLLASFRSLTHPLFDLMKSPALKLFPGMLDTHSGAFTKQTWVGWPSVPGLNRMRRKLGSRMRSGQSPGSSLATLQTSYKPADTIRSLRAHKWSIYDGQYILLAVLSIFCLSIMEFPGVIVKTVVSTLLMISLILPITRQFFLPFLPIATWLLLFFSCRYVVVNFSECHVPRSLIVYLDLFRLKYARTSGFAFFQPLRTSYMVRT